MNKVKQWDHSKLHLNPSKLVYQRMMDLGYGNKFAQDQAHFVKECMGCCIFKNHEIAVDLKQIQVELGYFKTMGVCKDIYELICLTISHETIELLINDETHDGMAWHYYADKLRYEGFMC